jgi:hypothetical protein
MFFAEGFTFSDVFAVFMFVVWFWLLITVARSRTLVETRLVQERAKFAAARGSQTAGQRSMHVNRSHPYRREAS